MEGLRASSEWPLYTVEQQVAVPFASKLVAPNILTLRDWKTEPVMAARIDGVDLDQHDKARVDVVKLKLHTFVYWHDEVHNYLVDRASSNGTEQFNTVSVAEEILALRNELAQMLGFQTFADLSLAQKTAPSVLAVEEMINAHHDKSDPVVETKFQQLQTFADPMATTDSWSNGTWLFWYALQHSSDGAAGIARRRTFFFDPYARPGQKRHGGWINETVNRSKVLGIPEHLVRVADFNIVCNLPPPMEQEGLPFTSSLARVTRTRSMETVVAVPLPPLTPTEMDELRMQSVERAAATSSHFSQVTYDELAQFHAQQSAMAQHLEVERPLSMAAAMEKNRQEQEESRAALSRQQGELVRQLKEMKRAMAEQSRLSEAHHDMLRQASDAMLQQHYKVEELNQKVRRVSEQWGLFAEEASQRSALRLDKPPKRLGWRT
ncbi:hypothetical protein DYB32_008611 [Aphanomyces invadans]|uniref:Peptidase M3A/M3B catalytic domain-containing protein n=1 Tax=Aphanomyces invadans TaxID=157072 RepID=A0A418AKU7_9STRA|nr:hypothetical protein DYB32_008611 [Aphanomyces invadans]